MALTTFVSGQVLTAQQLNDSYAAVGGLRLIKTVTVGTAVTTVNVTSCFDTTYANYRVSWSGITASDDGASMQFKMLVSTTANTNGMYGNTYYVVNGTTAALTAATAVSNGAAGECGSLSNAYVNAGWVDVMQPNIASATYTNFLGADDNYLRFGAYTVRNTTQYDGIQLLPVSGTLTGGTIRIYGYANTN